MKRGDEVWLFVYRSGYCGEKILERGTLILKRDSIWHVKTKKKIYKRKTSEIAKVIDFDRRLYDNNIRRTIQFEKL